MDKHTDLILRLQDEADLCRNDGASDIAALLDEAVEALRDRNHDTAVGEKWRTDSRLEEWFPLTAERLAALEAENAALKREAHTWWTAARDALAQRQSREGVAEDLYGRLESLSKAMESSGRIDEHEHPDAYGAILDAMKYVQADLNAPEAQPGAPGFDGADAWNAYGA